MTKIIIIFVGVLTLSACKKQNNIPVSPDKMIKILTDIHIAEAAAGHLTASKKDSILQLYYRQVFEIHGIRHADFDSTMSILRAKPNWLEQIYGKVMEELNTKKAKSDS